MNRPQYRIVTSSEQDLFQERLNRLIEELPEDATLGDIQFTSAVSPSGAVVFSALVAFVQAEPWTNE